MIIELLIGALTISVLANIAAFLCFLSQRETIQNLVSTNSGLHCRLIEQEEDIELAQRRSDLLKEKLNNVEALVGNTKLPIKVLRAQVITEIKK
ncbi:hypothetical protein [Brucella melitensis]|uniref:hypothetical protein n=1 Tax=Brucella melitensis TaxID=29459 RepID=UPI0032C04A63